MVEESASTPLEIQFGERVIGTIIHGSEVWIVSVLNGRLNLRPPVDKIEAYGKLESPGDISAIDLQTLLDDKYKAVAMQYLDQTHPVSGPVLTTRL